MRFLTIKDIQDILQLHERQARALMRTKDFPSIKIGREYRVEESSLKNWLENTKEIKLDYSKC